MTKNWFISLGKNVEERTVRIWSDKLDVEKGRLLSRLWREKDKIKLRKENSDRDENKG